MAIIDRCDKPTIERFWGKVHCGRPDECWDWTGHKYPNGYGQFDIRCQKHLAHRLAYHLAVGPIPHDLWILHKCDNRRCCNPAHLRLGTMQDNVHDAIIRNRYATGERHGSKLHPEKIRRGDNHGMRLHPECAARGDKNGARLHPERLAYGERSKQAKLTEKQVVAIRSRFATGKLTQAKLAKEYGVTRTTITLLVNGCTWKHLLAGRS